jgi:hypothetical protein
VQCAGRVHAEDGILHLGVLAVLEELDGRADGAVRRGDDVEAVV